MVLFLFVSSSPETLWGLTNMVTQGDANYVAPICVTIFAVPRPLLQSSKGANGDAKFPNHVVRKNKTGEVLLDAITANCLIKG